ncbi:MAG: hypothetical protein MJ238_03605 [Bacilli bacterium]|nr:hypothetical protein [Bacilli bacterium]
MKKNLFSKTQLLLLASSLTACTLSMGMTQKSISAGIAYVENVLQRYSDENPIPFAYKSGIITLTIKENVITEEKKKEVETLRKSFSLVAGFDTAEAGTVTSIYAKKEQPFNPDFVPTTTNKTINKSTDGVVSVEEDETVRPADPDEDFYSYFDLPYIIDTLVNRNTVRYLSSSLKSVTEAPEEEEPDQDISSEETHKFNNILTGFNIDYAQSSGKWSFAIYSDYLENEEYSDQLGFVDSSYTRFFRYSSIDSHKAHTLKYRFENNMVTDFEALYEEHIEEMDEVVRGYMHMNVKYGTKDTQA